MPRFQIDLDDSSSCESPVLRRGMSVLAASLVAGVTALALAASLPAAGPAQKTSRSASTPMPGERRIALRAGSPAAEPVFFAAVRDPARDRALCAMLGPTSWRRAFASPARAVGLPRTAATWPMVGFADQPLDRGARFWTASLIGPPPASRRHRHRARDLLVAVGKPWRFHLKTPDEAARDLGDADAAEIPTLATADPTAGLVASAAPGALTLDPLAENRQAAKGLGNAADALRFDDRPGRLSTAAQAIEWNGQPATALGVGYTLPGGRARLDAAGVTPMTGLMTSGLATIRKTFGVSTVASLNLN